MQRIALSMLLISNGAGGASLTIPQFQEKMRTHMRGLPAQTTAGVQVEVLGTGQDLFSYNEGQTLVPASGSKLMMTAAALQHVGASHTYQTTVIHQGDDLHMVGTGDPTLLSQDLWELAKQVASAGITKIRSIKINNSAFLKDYDGLHKYPGADDDFTSAIISATNLNYNAAQIRITPDAKSTRPHIELGPRRNGYAIFTNNVTHVKGTKANIRVRSLGKVGDREAYEVTGTIGKGAKTRVEYLKALNPAAHMAYGFAALLRDLGIAVEIDNGGVTHQPMSPGGRVVATHRSRPLNFIANMYMPPSNNYLAEQVFQSIGPAIIGGPASIENSQAGMHRFFRRLSDCAGSKMENGSGLSYKNRISARCFAQAIQSLNEQGMPYIDLVNSLPVGGKTGTLKSRFKRNGSGFVPSRVRAKTGTLWGQGASTALIGITKISSGETVIFALIENDTRPTSSVVRGLKVWEDKAVEYMQQLKL